MTVDAQVELLMCIRLGKVEMKGEEKDKMRIIDKNTDYYDYLQNSKDSIVFDRRGSYLLTKDRLCKALVPAYYNNIYTKDRQIQEKYSYKYLLLQCGATFWLILLYDVRYNDYGRPTEYKMELLSTWKDYSKSREVLKLTEISFMYYTLVRQKKKETYYEFIKSNVPRMVAAIQSNNLSTTYNLNNHEVILTACGIAKIIDPVSMFTAIEEHFSLLKTESERIDPIDATNDDKIEMHGFDTKTSFRGKQKRKA